MKLVAVIFCLMALSGCAVAARKPVADAASKPEYLQQAMKFGTVRSDERGRVVIRDVDPVGCKAGIQGAERFYSQIEFVAADPSSSVLRLPGQDKADLCLGAWAIYLTKR